MTFIIPLAPHTMLLFQKNKPTLTEKQRHGEILENIGRNLAVG